MTTTIYGAEQRRTVSAVDVRGKTSLQRTIQTNGVLLSMGIDTFFMQYRKQGSSLMFLSSQRSGVNYLDV